MMKLSLTPDLERIIEERVSSGAYATADEVVRRALELLREYEEKLVQLRLEIDRGLADVEAGNVLEEEEVYADIEKLGRERRMPKE